MTVVVEIIAMLALVGVVALLIHRFPDTRKSLGEEVDDALCKGSVRASWFFVALGAVVLVAVWLVL